MPRFRTPLLRKLALWLRDGETPETFERREFLKKSAGLAVLFPAGLMAANVLSSCATKPTVKKPASQSNDPVIILGAGIAGLSAAYEFTRAGQPCEIYEASSRVGGRMFTKSGFNSSAMTCELGGELVDSDHDDLLKLCADFKIEVDRFAPGDRGLSSNLYFFGGRIYTDKDLVRAFQPFARRLRQDRKKAFPEKAPDGFVSEYARRLDKLSLEEYLARFRDVDAWVIELIRVAYVSELALDAGDQSAIGLLSMLEPETNKGFKIYGDSDQAMKIRGGNICLIEALQNFLREKSVPIHTGKPVIAIADDATGVRLEFGGDSRSTVTSKRVLCTLPFSALRNLEGIELLKLSELKLKCIRELAYGTAAKMMTGYTKRVWREGITHDKRLVPRSNGMVYADGLIQNTWESSRTQIGTEGILTSYNGGASGAKMDAGLLSSYRTAIDRIFPTSDSLFDGHFATFNWTGYRWNLGSYAASRPGQSFLFGDIAAKPELSGRLHFAGEHAAGKSAGFMNGGCRSGRLAALAMLRN